MIKKRLWLALFAIPICLASMLVIGAQISHPAAAGGADITRPLTAGTCTSNSSCLSETNNGKGAGVAGISLLGKGVVGETKFKSTGSSTGTAGVYGTDLSTSGSFDSGVSGLSVRGYGVAAQSALNNAVHAVNTTNGDAISASANSGSGLVATTNSGTALVAFATAGNGLSVGSGNGFGAIISGSLVGISSQTPAGSGSFPIALKDGLNRDVFFVNGIGNVISGSTSGIGIDSSTASGDGAFLHSGSGRGAVIQGTSYGVLGVAPSGSSGDPFVAEDTGSNILFYVDGSGSVFYHGTLNHFAATRSGKTAMSFGPATTTPSLEDVGSAQLVNGQTLVPLDPTFAQGIDLRAPYHVFLTPNGDTRGLYVASKGPNGFVVRETQNGHGTLAFDYRIVATALGHASERMRLVSPPRGMPLPRTLAVKPPVQPRAGNSIR